MNGSRLRIDVRRDASGAPELTVAGEIDMLSTGELSDAVRAALADAPHRVVLDLGGVTFCDSLGLGTLMLLNREAAAARSVLVLTNVGDSLLRTLDITGLRALLTIH
ncbi:hypothetical protein GCM10010124_12710 [Pilimelia terevasa]|uniref:Anti-sigma factor antagonist n=1 Tax=Pilimelia terevasa TaxID=53372 RepID=A0A8J3BNC8_9ACTN|nr:STAS domain-containing protein [Pilimelia terevasa]GGK21682.1 hypothetical protein GCM10010124_12710 [Pilimelia terevasa]